ncbi:MarR family transcriptional regulator [Fusobacterium simiae]|uniref:MarR family transcriptional regulator n=1 Tax=Fusobacterium simiae TaxID=855 RepID=A0ABT4DMR0_FUSSI|nr:MarR family transcriptional regulator [Fusobacterium simiae]MCY7009273.1 MarR family transcriptional regulator [Fusobacterium simiae]
MKIERTYARRLTTAIFKINGIENSIDKKVGIGYAELCLMYALDDGLPHSQKQISEEWEISKTTLNTIVKRWEREGILILNKIPGKRREMEISLTDIGLKKAKEALKRVYLAEEFAIKETIKKYSDMFIEVLEFYAESLKKISENLDIEEE